MRQRSKLQAWAEAKDLLGHKCDDKQILEESEWEGTSYSTGVDYAIHLNIQVMAKHCSAAMQERKETEAKGKAIISRTAPWDK